MLNEYDAKVIGAFLLMITISVCTYFVTNADIRIELDHMVTPITLDGDATAEPIDRDWTTEDQPRDI